MRRLSFVITGILALSMGGCGVFGGGDETATEIAPVPSPTVEATVQPSPEPLIAEQPGPRVPPDLIQSTNADQRVAQIQRSRQDPFALLPTTPIIETQAGAAGGGAGGGAAGGGATQVGQRSVPQLPGLPSPQGTGRPGSAVGAGTPGTLPGPLPPSITPITREGSPFATLPPLPQPDLATAVVVTGVVQVGDAVQAIVQAPNELTSRYVRAGQRLSNGQVLVKRIELNEGADPVVVLEQNGVEVFRAVGEGAPASGTPTAAAITPPQLVASQPF